MDGAAAQNTHKNKKFEHRCVREMKLGEAPLGTILFGSVCADADVKWIRYGWVCVRNGIGCGSSVTASPHFLEKLITELIEVHVKGQTIGQSRESCALSVNMTFALGALHFQLKTGPAF